MPPKVYLESPPFGDFRAMPARGDGLALLKWVTSFPGNPERGLPTVTGVICVSDAENGEPLMLLDARSVTALRTGAVAAVAAEALARQDAKTVGIIGCGLHGAWAARCLAAAGYGPGLCYDPATGGGARARAASSTGIRARARPRSGRTSSAASRRALRSWSMPAICGPDCTSTCSGPMARGRPRQASAPWRRVRSSATSGSRPHTAASSTGAVQAGLVARDQVTELGAVLAGEARGRPGPEAVTLFDSTGLAIQDLAVSSAALEAWREGRVQGQTVRL